MTYNHWQTYRLGDITTWSSGGTPSKSNLAFWNGTIPWVSAKSLLSNEVSDADVKITNEGLVNGSRLAPIDSILLLVRGSGLFNRLPVGIVKKPVAFNQDIKCIITNNEILDPRFLLYWLEGNSAFLNNKLEETGIGAGKFDTQILKNLMIRVPSFPIQRELIIQIKAIDDKIELNRQTNETLESIAQAIFREWFIDKKISRLSSESKNESRNTTMKFRAGKLGDVSELIYGKALRAEHRIAGKYPVVGSGGIVDYHDQYLVNGPGIVIGRKGTLGEVTWIHESFFPIDTTFYIKDKLQVNGLYYHYFLLKHQDFKKIASDSAVPGLNRNEAMNNEISLPDASLINHFNSVVKPLFDVMNCNEQQSQTLTKLRDTLLPKLMKGEISIKETEKQLSEV